MRRWLLIFFVFLIPFHFSWAMSAAYCAHENDSRTQHWGHHEHPGTAADERTHADPGAAKDAGNAPGAPVVDCALCHFGHAQHAVAVPAALPGAAGMPRSPRATHADAFDSHISEVPVRPARTPAA